MKLQFYGGAMELCADVIGDRHRVMQEDGLGDHNGSTTALYFSPKGNVGFLMTYESMTTTIEAGVG